MKPLLFLRVGYMQRYDGPAEITSGGAFPEEKGVGGEIFNFKPSGGRCYGYAMTRNFSGINLDKLAPGVARDAQDQIDGVDVVFFARRPGFGQVIVGWYLGATVYGRQYRRRRGRIPGMENKGLTYLCDVDARHAKLMPEKSRTFRVPPPPSKRKGFPGQSQVWYPAQYGGLPAVRNFLAEVRRYIGSRRGQDLPPDEVEPRRGHARSRVSDAAHNAAVEQAAVTVAWSYWRRQGYTVESVETDNLGWDLEVQRGRVHFKVEVKGLSGDTVNFQLTPNEYSMLQGHSREYRVCVVLDALGRPELFELSPRRSGNGWMLVGTRAKGITVRLAERTAAIGVEVMA